MKYIRKVMAAALALTFLIALVIGTGVMLSVRNVNVSFTESTGEYKAVFEEANKNLKKLKGSGLLFVNEDDVLKKIDDTKAEVGGRTVKASDVLSVVKFEKKFPCTLDVYVEERVECFAVKTSLGYDVLDGEGKVIKSVESEGVPVSSVDGSPLVLLKCSEGEIANLTALAKCFKENFGDLRRLTESVSAEKFMELRVATFKLRSDMDIAIRGWDENGEQKIKKACETYKSLPDSKRVGGTVWASDGRDGAGVISKYYPPEENPLD